MVYCVSPAMGAARLVLRRHADVVAIVDVVVASRTSDARRARGIMVVSEGAVVEVAQVDLCPPPRDPCTDASSR